MHISFTTKTDLVACENDCQFAVDHQIPAVDITISDVTSLSIAHIKALRTILNAYGLRCASFGLLEMNHLVDDARQRQFVQMQRTQACEYAAMLDASVFVTTSGMRSTILDENAYVFAQELAPTIATLTAQGMRFAVQPAGTGFIDCMSAYERVWSLIGQVYCVYDPVMLRLSHDDELAFVHKHARRIAHVKASDVLWHQGQRIASPPVGMGDVRWASIMALLYEGDYNGALSITPSGSFWGRTSHRQRMILLSQQHLQQYLFDADGDTILATKPSSFYGTMV